jgi:hypothetical protein
MPEELYKHDGERRIALVEIFAGKAEWRRQKAVEHPDDKRNLEAATIFDRLRKVGRWRAAYHPQCLL